MDIAFISKIVFGIITSVGGIGAVIVGAVHFSSNIIAEKLSQKYQLEMDKQLEEYKAKLNNGNHISRALFDKELETYQSLFGAFSIAYNKLKIYHGINTSRGRIVPTQELLDLMSSNNNQEKIDFMLKQQRGEVITEIDANKLVEEIAEHMLKFQLELGRCAALIPYDIYKLFLDLYNRVFNYIQSKDENDYQTVISELGKLQSNLRKYLHELTIIE